MPVFVPMDFNFFFFFSSLKMLFLHREVEVSLVLMNYDLKNESSNWLSGKCWEVKIVVESLFT